MAFRDYNDDGKIDFMDDMIEDEIFYEDDDELNARFRSIHNTLNSKPRSYSMGRFAADSEKRVHKPTLNRSIENFENYLTASKKPSFEEIIYSVILGATGMLSPNLLVLIRLLPLLAFFLYPISCLIVFWIMRVFSLRTLIKELKATGYEEYLYKNREKKGFAEKNKVYIRTKNRMYIQYLLFLIYCLTAIVSIPDWYMYYAM